MKFAKKIANFSSWLAAHFIEAMTTGITTFAAIASLFLAESIVMKLACFLGFLALGFVISIGLAKSRGEDKEF
ncbi:hypothetical protein J2125_004565 [Erwinia toletana]|uniref:Uncharacterized protein n=1 Tax=Winslowiella toletana TaxID=92490 RepID=A0ABS4PHK4_9GAMM|nr:hypothetical protein [Winslowiella toletana]MBP2171373.1 hypothetical protein [Winslowiella toletana]